MPLEKEHCKESTIKNDQIVLSPEYIKKMSFRFKKITGTRFAAILGKSKYTSPFVCWMGMVNLYKDTMDKTLADAGNIIEPKIRDYVEQKLGQKYISYDPVKCKFDMFKDNKVFGGIPDGEPVNEEGAVDYSNDRMLLEIKTSSIDTIQYRFEKGNMSMVLNSDGVPKAKAGGEGKKRETWFEGNDVKIPEDYKFQVGLYLYLRHTTKACLCVGFLKLEDYAHPENFDINNREMRIVKIDLDLESFKTYIDYATKWYETYITKGISPVMTEADRKWLNEQYSYIK